MRFKGWKLSMDASDDAGDDVGLAAGRAHEVAEGTVGDAAQLSEESAVVQEEGPQALGDGEHEHPVRDSVEELVVEPVGPDLESLGVACGTENPRLATEGHQELGPTAIAADASETSFEESAVQELLRGAPGRGQPDSIRPT